MRLHGRAIQIDVYFTYLLTLSTPMCMLVSVEILLFSSAALMCHVDIYQCGLGLQYEVSAVSQQYACIQPLLCTV